MQQFTYNNLDEAQKKARRMLRAVREDATAQGAAVDEAVSEDRLVRSITYTLEGRAPVVTVYKITPKGATFVLEVDTQGEAPDGLKAREKSGEARKPTGANALRKAERARMMAASIPTPQGDPNFIREVTERLQLPLLGPEACYETTYKWLAFSVSLLRSELKTPELSARYIKARLAQLDLRGAYLLTSWQNGTFLGVGPLSSDNKIIRKEDLANGPLSQYAG